MVNLFSHQSHAELLAMNMWGCGLWVFASYLLYRCSHLNQDPVKYSS